MASPVIASPRRPRYRRLVVCYDRLYRVLHGLDRPATQVGPALRVAVRRLWRARRLPDGTALARGARIGVLHLNNERLAALHVDGLGPMAIGLELRRLLFASLRALAAAVAAGPFADVRAFVATTIFHERLQRLGFVPEPRAPAWARLHAAYQRALLASLHPAGALRLRRLAYQEARRVWLSREALLARYGPEADVSRVADGA